MKRRFQIREYLLIILVTGTVVRSAHILWMYFTHGIRLQGW